LGCTAGIMITASHNPPKYNGYKVYWDDGAQIIPPKDKQIIDEVNKTEFSAIKTMDKEEAIEKGLYNVVGDELDTKFINTLKDLVLNPEAIKSEQDNIKIVYTPLHGTGNIPVQTILNKLGFEHVYVVPAQELPNGDFPTVELPNPEDPKAFAMALDLAKEKDADLVLATDPDADRLGVYAKDSTTGEYKSFTGNMSGLLIAEYILSQMKANKTLPKNGALVTTIVSSNLAQAISKEYGIEFIETLTGFKYIGEKIRQFESSGSNTFLFGFEESYGCLVGTHARDKDAIVAVMMLCEAAAYYKDKGLTLWDQMIKIYEKYGFYKETIATFTLKGADGAARIQEIMNNVRNIMPTKIGDHSVIQFRDYKLDKTIDIKSKKEGKTGLPNSNVLYFDLDNNAWCCIRPSGTEPKIKLYMGVKGKSIKDSEEKLNKLRKAMIKLIEN
jgi:phosphoglucomutase